MADCFDRSRRFTVFEALVKPLRLLKRSFWSFYGAFWFMGLVGGLLPTLISLPFDPDGSNMVLLVFVLLLQWILQILTATYGGFLFGVTYKQAKARLMLESRR